MAKLFSAGSNPKTKVEQAVMSHLARIGDACFYNDGKREIDCVVKRGEDLIGVEVKWSSKLVPSDGYAVLKTKKPYLLGKETFGKVGRVNAIPACLFLAMLEIEEITKRDVLKLA